MGCSNHSLGKTFSRAAREVFFLENNSFVTAEMKSSHGCGMYAIYCTKVPIVASLSSTNFLTGYVQIVKSFLPGLLNKGLGHKIEKPI
jgi:hypothetical protein